MSAFTWLTRCLVAVVFGVALAAVAAPPNIVVIVSDDQGYNDLGVTNDAILTPNLDRLASEGLRLTDFYVAWPACTPSRGSLLTGRYPQRNGLYDMIRNDVADLGVEITPEDYPYTPERILGMDTREMMISDILSDAGYACGVFGKWDGGQLKRFLPLQRGFDAFYGFTNTGIDYYTHERYGTPSMYRDNMPTVEDKGAYATYLFERESLRFLEARREQPFFLYVPFNAPHGASNLDPAIRGSVQAPDEFRAMYPELLSEAGLQKGQRYGQEAMVPNRAERDLGYKAAVTCMDASIGKILDALEAHGVADNTIVIFFSDNGGSGGADNSPLNGRKGQVLEGGVRVPCLIRWPRVTRPGTVSDAFVTALDLFPTLAAAAGAPLPEGVVIDGYDIRAALGGGASPREAMFWQRREEKAARVGHWKWVDAKRGSGLYDLSEDIGEQNDLSKERPEILKMMRERFAAWRAEMDASEPRGPFRDF
ncbi:MAG: sulfatase-like hydrolase/transferase [Candidatus Hydrogenedentes bacterium]|nr:sulfatase-like hydrolase/transferase [Candidatus Hydrogenedentota bacterium]